MFGEAGGPAQPGRARGTASRPRQSKQLSLSRRMMFDDEGGSKSYSHVLLVGSGGSRVVASLVVSRGKTVHWRERYGLVIRCGRRAPFLISGRGGDDFWWPRRDKRNHLPPLLFLLGAQKRLGAFAR